VTTVRPASVVTGVEAASRSSVLDILSSTEMMVCWNSVKSLSATLPLFG
jgi:hypothetical protein